MPKKVLALKITPQTYQVYLDYPGIQHYDLDEVNDQFLVRDDALPNGYGHFNKRDFDTFYRATRSPMYFKKFTECLRIPPNPNDLPEKVLPKRIRE